MKTRKIFVIMLGIAGSLFLIQACKKDVISGQAPVSTGTAAIRVKLTDAPANYLQVNVDIKQVRIHISADSNSTDGWIDLPTNAGIYNLLELRNGIDTTLVDSTLIPAGKVSQIRFVLGPNSSVMTADSVLHDLKVPSGQQSGLKINVHRDIPAGYTFNLLLDFDAEKSVNEKGNGDFSMKPVIRIK
ncbi:MAG TPA: DUF4382 domain-containing protein [Bacteroidia bacterium]|jgi:hypothetical protein|nr:DUF4382 domain-containing protein [Bacteroidia bacterium]HRG53523.1 DUF4382 domain-containing protein [Bacteroidia bacterium]